MATKTHNKIKVEVNNSDTLTGEDWEELTLEKTWAGRLADEPLCRALIKVIDRYNSSDDGTRDTIILTLANIAGKCEES